MPRKLMRVIAEPADAREGEAARRYAKLYLVLKNIEARVSENAHLDTTDGGIREKTEKPGN